MSCGPIVSNVWASIPVVPCWVAAAACWAACPATSPEAWPTAAAWLASPPGSVIGGGGVNGTRLPVRAAASAE